MRTQEYSLFDVIEVIGGGTPKTNIKDYWQGDIPWLTVKDFNNDSKYVFSTEKTITNEGLINSSTKILNKNDIILSSRGTVGQIAMLAVPMAFNQSCYGIRGKNIITQDFLYYFLKNNINTLKANSHGSVFSTITIDTFKNIKINLPNLNVQKTITHILSCLDDKILINKRINDNL